MRNKKISATFFIALMLYALINFIMFMNVDSLRTDSEVFWIAWSFAFPLPILILAYLGFAVKWKNILIQKPMLYPSVVTAALIYLGVGFIFMFAPIDSIKAVIITEVIISVFFIIALFIAKRSADYITSNQAYTKKKVAFLRMLKADVDDLSRSVSEPMLAAALLELSEQIRYSDPMSSPALAPYEERICSLIGAAAADAGRGSFATAASFVKEASMALESRNQRCKILK